MRARITILLGAVVLAAGLLAVGPASPASAGPCGFYKAAGSGGRTHGYWHNCHPYLGNYVQADRIVWPDSYYCIPPGVTKDLGTATGDWGDVRGAHMIYEGCPY